MVHGVSVRTRGLLWALVCSPVVGWAATLYGDRATHGHLGISGAVVLMGILPAALTSAGNAALRRGPRAVARAGMFAAAVCYLGFLVFVLVFFLTVPREFFQ
jgi:predicted membrane protein